MEIDEDHTRLAGIGLCGVCLYRRAQVSKRGRVFYRCARADADPSFSRYPPLPVLRCSGHEPGEPAREG